MSKDGFKSQFQICFDEEAGRDPLEENEWLSLEAHTMSEAHTSSSSPSLLTL